jgi:hypothetical protein
MQEEVDAYWNGKENNSANSGLILPVDIIGSGSGSRSARASLLILSLIN